MSTFQRFFAIMILFLAILLPPASALLFPRDTIEGAFDDPAIVPAGYAFAIWGPIYLLMIVFGIAQLLATRRLRPLIQDLRTPVMIALAATNLWLLFAWYENIWGTFIVMIGIHIPLALARISHRGSSRGSGERLECEAHGFFATKHS